MFSLIERGHFIRVAGETICCSQLIKKNLNLSNGALHSFTPHSAAHLLLGIARSSNCSKHAIIFEFRKVAFSPPNRAGSNLPTAHFPQIACALSPRISFPECVLSERRGKTSPLTDVSLLSYHKPGVLSPTWINFLSKVKTNIFLTSSEEVQPS